jgi:hypothetical protein
VRQLNLVDKSVKTIGGIEGCSYGGPFSETPATSVPVCFQGLNRQSAAAPGVAPGEVLLLLVDSTRNSVVVLRRPPACDACATMWTLAGGGLTGKSGAADGVGTNALFTAPRGIAATGSAADGSLVLFIADRYSVSRLDFATAAVTRIAGNAAATSGAFVDGAGLAARFYFLAGIEPVPGRPGLFYVTDTLNARIRLLDSATGEVTTVLGDGSKTDPAPDGAPGGSATTVFTYSIAARAAGGVWFSDQRELRYLTCPDTAFPTPSPIAAASQSSTATPSPTASPATQSPSSTASLQPSTSSAAATASLATATATATPTSTLTHAGTQGILSLNSGVQPALTIAAPIVAVALLIVGAGGALYVRGLGRAGGRAPRRAKLFRGHKSQLQTASTMVANPLSSQPRSEHEPSAPVALEEAGADAGDEIDEGAEVTLPSRSWDGATRGRAARVASVVAGSGVPEPEDPGL